MEPGAMTEAGGKTSGMETRKLITATDNQYSAMLLKALDEQRGLGVFCDVTVIVEDRKFRAHRNVLSASSTYFHELFSVAGQVVELNFLRAEIFAEILNYIYSSRIVRVRSDLLDELIKSGQLLGVKFLADLGPPLQQVKNMSRGVNPDTSEPSNLDANGLEARKSPVQPASQNSIVGKPVMTERFYLYGEECDTTKITISDSDDDDDDVIFCAELVPPKDRPQDTETVMQNQPCPNPAGGSDQTACNNAGSPPQPAVMATPRPDLSTAPPDPAENQMSADPLVPSPPKPVTSDVRVLNQSQISASPDVGSSHEIEVSPIPEENQQPSNNSLLDMETNVIEEEEEEEEEDVEDDDDILGLSSPGSASSSSLVQQPTTPKPAASEAAGVPKQVVNFPQEPPAPPPEFKMKISNVLSISNKDAAASVAPKHITEGQKTITLDTATEIEGLSTGCKVYANIGEDTYDIVIPVKNEADGEVRLDDVPRTSGDDPTNRKRLKVKHDDHYELIMDGKVYYICIVCRRSYVCLTSLRRHFNVHSWERKYPCRYCDKVFPLAEYRTKHEIHHTGERRYQCLACGQCFINYQVMATHLRSVHSQDPSGESKLYRLHPCRSLQIRNYAYISGGSNNIPIVNDNNIAYPVAPLKEPPQEPTPAPQAKPMTWDDIFVPQANESLFKQNPSDGSTEFEFVIPESY